MKILVTGAAGFIGSAVSRSLVADGNEVVGIDNLNDYYDTSLKEARLGLLTGNQRFVFHLLDLADRQGISSLFREEQFNAVINLGGQAGVRYSLLDPEAYVDSNLVGFANILEGCRNSGVGHLVFASSSSVYGGNTQQPFSTSDSVDSPLSLYAATKKANELMAHSYSHLYGLPTTGLRFFTVYGPWGRPDMAYFSFTKAILAGEPIKIFNHGDMSRDFTYIDDIVEGVVRVLRQPAGYRVYNIGNNHPERLLTMVTTLERLLGKESLKEFLPMQAGDVPVTFASIDDLVKDTGFSPSTPLAVGLEKFVDWYLDYYRGRGLG